MFPPIHFDSFISLAFFSSQPLLNSLQSDITQRAKDIAIAAFKKMTEFFTFFNNQSNEINLKTFALISCVSLIALLVISMLLRKDSRLIDPPTPEKHV